MTDTKTKTKAQARKEILQGAETHEPAVPRSPEWQGAWGALKVAQDEHAKAAHRVSVDRWLKEEAWFELPNASMNFERTKELQARIAELVIEIPQAQLIKARAHLAVVEARRDLNKVEADEAIPERDRTFAALQDAQKAYEEANNLYEMKWGAARYSTTDIASARTEIDRWSREVREAIGVETLPVVRTHQRVAR